MLECNVILNGAFIFLQNTAVFLQLAWMAAMLEAILKKNKMAAHIKIIFLSENLSAYKILIILTPIFCFYMLNN